MGVIYKITNLINGKCYIGQSIHDAKIRWNDHINGYHPNSLIHKAIEKYGVDKFKFEEIEYPDTPEALDIREQYWIRTYNSLAPNGYNLTIGGDGCPGYKMSDEIRKKLSNMRKGKPWTNKQREVLSVTRIGNNNAGKSVAMYDGDELLATFPSARAASRVTGVDATAIGKACKKKT